MIRINIIGKGFLDMTEGAGLSFKRENQQFRFCDISLGRSVEFTIPATRHNRELLGYGDDPSFYGDMLRDKHAAQIIYDYGTFRATLSVTSFEGESFKCVLLLDNMPWLADLQNLKLSDMTCPWTHGLIWDNAYVMSPADPNLYVFLNGEGKRLINYDDGVNGCLLPCINVKAFIEDMLTERGIPNSINIPREYWLVMPTIKGASEETVTMASLSTNDLTITGGTGLLDVVTVDLEYATGELFGALVGGGTVTAKAFKALYNIEITFPMAFPSDCYLVQYSKKLKNYVTLGGVDTYGTSDPHGGESIGVLDGKTVSLKKGYTYFFAPNPWQVDWAMPNGYVGYKDTFNPYNFTFKVATNGDISQGDTWYMRNNMPDMTLFEFLKSAALSAGLELLVTENGIDIVKGLYGSPFKVCKNVLSIDSVARRVEAWGSGTRKVEVCFDSEDYVTNPLRWGYYIDNDQLEGSKETKVKFSEGDIGGTGGVLIKDIDMGSTPPKILAKKPTIAYADPNEKMLVRVPDASMVGYNDIASDSTCIRMKMKAGNKEFFQLQPFDVWLWRGMAYIWTDADWSDGVLTLTLQKVSQARAQSITPPPPPPTPADYVQDGLVLLLDGIEQGGELGKWVDLVGGHNFTAHGGVTFEDNCVTFDGINGYLNNNTFTTPSSNTGTIEIVFEKEGSTAQVLYAPTSGSQRLAFYLSSTNLLVWTVGSSLPSYQLQVAASVSVNSNGCYLNGSNISPNTNYSMGMSSTSYNRIGCRYNNNINSNFLKGKIYCIRIYNRQLTADEVEANRQVDIVRFGIGN